MRNGTKTSKQWMMEHINDVYVQRAKTEGYRSRAAYKLIEVAARDKLLKQGMVVVDLGAAPGGWSQVAAAKAGAGGRVIALDLLPMDALRNVTFLQGDFREDAVVNAAGANWATSDRPCIKRYVPQYRRYRPERPSVHLAELALGFAAEHLKPGGSLLVKVFQGFLSGSFARGCAAVHPDAETRGFARAGRNNELYLLGKERKAGI